MNEQTSSRKLIYHLCLPIEARGQTLYCSGQYLAREERHCLDLLGSLDRDSGWVSPLMCISLKGMKSFKYRVTALITFVNSPPPCEHLASYRTAVHISTHHRRCEREHIPLRTDCCSGVKTALSKENSIHEHKFYAWVAFIQINVFKCGFDYEIAQDFIFGASDTCLNQYHI